MLRTHNGVMRMSNSSNFVDVFRAQVFRFVLPPHPSPTHCRPWPFSRSEKGQSYEAHAFARRAKVTRPMLVSDEAACMWSDEAACMWSDEAACMWSAWRGARPLDVVLVCVLWCLTPCGLLQEEKLHAVRVEW